MNAPLSDDLLRQLRGDGMAAIAARLERPVPQVEDSVAAALPLLLGAMGRTTRSPEGARALFAALERDHRGADPANVLGTVLSGGMRGEAAGALDHILGGRQPLAAQTLGAVGDLGEGPAGELLRMLAPVVLAHLARRVFLPPNAAGDTSPPSSPEGLARILENEERDMHAREGFGAGLLSMLDDEGDGGVELSDFIARGPAGLGVETAEMRSPRPLL